MALVAPESQRPAPRSAGHLVLRLLLVALIPLALVEAWWVTPGRDYWKEMDFAVFYTAGRMFAHGADPYDRANAERVWKDAGGDDDVMDVIWGPFAGDENDPHDRADHWLPVELIPPGLAVMAPVSLLPVGLAWPAWNYLVAVLFAGQLYATVRLMRRPLWDAASLAAILFTILLEPLHVGLANGQPTVPTISLLVLAVYWTTGRQTWAGVAFAVATALKPQLAAPFVLLFLFQGKWRTVVVAAVVGLALTAAAAGPMQVRHPEWVHAWTSELNAAEGSGNIDSARVDNPGRNDLLNLALLGHLLTDNATVVNAGCVAVWAAAVAALFYVNRHRRESLGTIAAFATLALLPMYHRFYDAGILVLAVAWALVHLRDRPTRWPAVGILAAGAVFCVSEDRIDRLFRSVTKGDGAWVVRDPAFAHRVASSWWFNGLAEPHHIWELLAVLACLTLGIRWLGDRPTPPQVPGPLGDGRWARHRVRLGVALLIPLAVLEGWWISYDRDYYKELDFGMYYTASRMFVQGHNPYSRAHAFATWTDADGEYDVMNYVLGPNPYDEDHPETYWMPINCIPPALAVIAPFAWFKVPVAWPAWNVVVGLLLVGQGIAVARLMKVPLWSVAALVMVLMTVLLDPLHTGLCNGQPAVPAVSLTVLAAWLAVANWQVFAGVALAVATALKPQLGGPFVLLFLWQRRFKGVAVAAVVGAALTLAAVVPLTAGRHYAETLAGKPLAETASASRLDFGWLTGPAGWLEEVRYAEVPGGINDARRADIGRHDMVHLQVLTHFFTDDATRANALAVLIVAGLGTLLWWTARGRATDLATISAFAILALLVAYHRLYDAGIIVLPIGWAIVHCRRGVARWPARVILVLSCVYFVQQEWIDEQFFGAAGHPVLSDAWWFNLFVEPHHQLELLAMFGCLVLSLRWQGRATAGRGFEPTRAVQAFAMA